MEKTDKNRYYGVAWNFIEDTYRVTGLLKAAKKYEDVEDILFIHNSIKKYSDGGYKIPKTYYREFATEKEHILEISDLPLHGFKKSSARFGAYAIIKILFDVDFCVYKSFPQTKPTENTAKLIKVFEDYLEQEKKEKTEKLLKTKQ